MDGMRFLFFAGGWIAGGMETAFLSLMKGLATRGHQPTAIVSGRRFQLGGQIDW